MRLWRFWRKPIDITPSPWLQAFRDLGRETVEPLPFVRFRDGHIVVPACCEMNYPTVSKPVPWKLGHGERRSRWEDRY